MVHPLPLVVGAAVSLLVLLAAWLLANAKPMAQRARRLTKRMAAHAHPHARPITARERTMAWLENWLDRFGLNRADSRRFLAEQLSAAGLNGADRAISYRSAQVALPVAGAACSYVLAPLLLENADPLVRMTLAACGFVAGIVAPRLWLKNKTQKRQLAVSRALPDALDLYVICAEAGLSLDAAMTRVARELRLASPELAEELGLTAIELGFLPNRHDAFDNLLKRMPLSAIRGLVGMFQQTERYGTPLADALRTLASEYRTRSLLRAEAKAAQLPAILTVPMIMFVLPPLFIVLVGPAILQVMAG